MTFDYPLSERGMTFMASRKKSNRVKAIVSHSKTKTSALRSLRKTGYIYHRRSLILTSLLDLLDKPEMINVPFE